MNNSIKLEYNSLVKELNKRKFNKWYKLKDIVELKNISYKSLKNMVAKIYSIYHPMGLIYKKDRRYFIHYTLIDAFKLKNQRKPHTIYSYNWLSNISWTTLDFYDKEYHEFLIKELKKFTPEVNYLQTIEIDKAGRFHVHLLADKSPHTIRPAIENLLNKYLDSDKFYKLYCEKIYNKGSSVDYLIKNPQ